MCAANAAIEKLRRSPPLAQARLGGRLIAGEDSDGDSEVQPQAPAVPSSSPVGVGTVSANGEGPHCSRYKKAAWVITVLTLSSLHKLPPAAEAHKYTPHDAAIKCSDLGANMCCSRA
jgi:hypothetical protein